MNYFKFSIFIEIKFVSVVRIIIDSLTYFNDKKRMAERSKQMNRQERILSKMLTP